MPNRITRTRIHNKGMGFGGINRKKFWARKLYLGWEAWF
jgi:hypothetical protein